MLNEVLSRLPYSQHALYLIKRCEEWMPRGLAKRAVLVGVTAGLVVYLITKKRYRLPPGPRGWPLIGNLLDFQKTTIYQKLIEWKTQYGPVISFNMGPVTVVALNSRDVILEALVKRQADFAGRPQSYSILLLTDRGKSIGFGDYTPTWKLHRKLAIKAVRYYMGGSRLEETIERSLTHGIKLMEQQRGPFNPQSFTTIIMFNIINSICFSYTCDINDEYVQSMVDIMNTFSNDIGNSFVEDFIPPIRLFPAKKLRHVIVASYPGFELTPSEYGTHVLATTSGTFATPCCWLRKKHEKRKTELLSQITDGHIIQTMADLFSADFDTSRITLDWSLLYLCWYPDIQNKLYQEIDKAMGTRRIPKMSDRSSLPYTDAVLHEVLRISSLSPLGLPHTTICDTKIGDYDIPKGTMVFTNLYAVHHDPENWDEPEVFKPERFLDKQGKMAPKPDSWLPFSAGRRVCLGESVAKPELQLLLAGIMRYFKLSLPPGAKIDMERRGGSFSNIPNDYEIVVETRQ